MRLSTGLILLCAMMIFAPVADAQEVDIMPLTNGGFETGGYTGWTTSGTGINIYNNPVQSGAWCSYIPATCSISQTFNGVAAGDIITYQIYERDANAAAAGRMDIIFKNSIGSTISTSSVTLDAGAVSYGLYSGDFTAPANTASIEFKVSCTSASYGIYVDTLSLWMKDQVTISETYSDGVAKLTFDYTPYQNTYILKCAYENIDWSTYSGESAATATKDGAGITVSEVGQVVTLTSTFIPEGNMVVVAKDMHNELSIISPTEAEVIPIDIPYNTVNIEWEEVAGATYRFRFSPDNFVTTWYNITQSDNGYTVNLNPGTYYWTAQVYDDTLAAWTAPDVNTFTISEAIPVAGDINITVRNEYDLSPVGNFSVFATDGTVSYLNTAINSIAISSAEGLSGECFVNIGAIDYNDRQYIINTPFNGTLYISPAVDNVLVEFSLIDYANTFPYQDTRLIVSFLSGSNDMIVSDAYFDAAGQNKVYLQTGRRYLLTLKSGGCTRITGYYTPEYSTSVSLVVGDIELVPASDTFGGFNYTLSKTNETVTFNWIAPAGSLTDEFSYIIYDSNETAVYSIASLAPVGTATYNYPDKTAQYKIKLIAPTTGGILRHTEYVSGETNLIDLQISDLWYNMISIFILFIIALTFGARSASVGALITSLFAVGLYAIGVFRGGILIISLCVILGIIAVLRGRGS